MEAKDAGRICKEYKEIRRYDAISNQVTRAHVSLQAATPEQVPFTATIEPKQAWSMPIGRRRSVKFSGGAGTHPL